MTSTRSWSSDAHQNAALAGDSASSSSAASFSAARALTSVRSGPPKSPACCPVSTTARSPRARDESAGSVPVPVRGTNAARAFLARARIVARSGRSGRKAWTSGSPVARPRASAGIPGTRASGIVLIAHPRRGCVPSISSRAGSGAATCPGRTASRRSSRTPPAPSVRPPGAACAARAPCRRERIP